MQKHTFLYLILIWFSLTGVIYSRDKERDNLKHSFAWVTVYYSKIDPSNPWVKHPPQKRAGQALYIGDGLYVILADILKNAHAVEMSLPDQPQAASAEVICLNPFYRLALLKLKNSNHLPQNIKTVKLHSDYLEENMAVTLSWITYKNRHISNEGRIDLIDYFFDENSRAGYVGYQVSSSQFKSHRSHFMFFKNKLAGIVSGYSKDNKTYEVIPSLRIAAFLERFKNNELETDFSIGFDIQNLKHGDTRKFLGLNPLDDSGIIVASVYRTGLGADVLEPQDVITHIGEVSVNSRGESRHLSGSLLPCFALFEDMRKGHPITMKVIRKKQEITLELLPQNKPEYSFIPDYEYGSELPYFHVNGLIFTEVSMDYLRNYGDNWLSRVPSFIAFYLMEKFNKHADVQEKERVVILLKVLPHESNQGYADLSNLVVNSINGENVVNLTQLKNKIEDCLATSETMEVTFKPDSLRSVFIVPSVVDKAREDISQRYGV